MSSIEIIHSADDIHDREELVEHMARQMESYGPIPTKNDSTKLWKMLWVDKTIP